MNPLAVALRDGVPGEPRRGPRLHSKCVRTPQGRSIGKLPASTPLARSWHQLDTASVDAPRRDTMSGSRGHGPDTPAVTAVSRSALRMGLCTGRRALWKRNAGALV